MHQAHEQQAGDLTENADYLDAVGAQEQLERRIAVLEQQLRDAHVVEQAESPPGRASLGRHVVLEDLDSGERERYRLVGSPEADLAEGTLSIESPVGRAIVDRSTGETVLVQAPHRQRRLKILAARSV